MLAARRCCAASPAAPTAMMATSHYCTLCHGTEEETAFRSSTSVCVACQRQVQRLGPRTECCGLLPVRRGNGLLGTYCPGCPGTDRVPVVLIAPDGRERTVYAPLTAYVAPNCTLGQLAERLGVDTDAVVLQVRDRRAWGTGRLDAVGKLLPVLVQARCQHCQVSFERWVRPKGRSRTLTCDACKKRLKSRWQAISDRRYEERQAALGLQCSACARPAGLLLRGPDGVQRCDACHKRQERNGLCAACGVPRIRRRKRPVCERCEPEAARKGGRQVLVPFTDGVQTRQVLIGAKERVQGRVLGSYLAPLVFISPLPAPNARLLLRNACVISGLHLPGTGETARLALGALREDTGSVSDAVEQLTEAFGSPEEARTTVVRLRVAGLLGLGGLTDRARAVRAWAQRAGVRM